MKKILIPLFFVLLGSCGPQYRTYTDYLLQPGNFEMGECAAVCSGNKHSCNNHCNSDLNACNALEETRARDAYEHYVRFHCFEEEITQYHGEKKHKTVAAENPGWKFTDLSDTKPNQYKPDAIKKRTKKTVCNNGNKSVANFKNTSRCTLAYDSCKTHCTDDYESCFTNCGGQINRRTVCVANCPVEPAE